MYDIIWCYIYDIYDGMIVACHVGVGREPTENITNQDVERFLAKLPWLLLFVPLRSFSIKH